MKHQLLKGRHLFTSTFSFQDWRTLYFYCYNYRFICQVVLSAGAGPNIQPFYSDFGNNFEMHCVYEPPTSSKEISTLYKFYAERLWINKKRNENMPCQVKTFYLDFHQISRVFNIMISAELSLLLILHAYPFHNAFKLKSPAKIRLQSNLSILQKLLWTFLLLSRLDNII